MSQRGLSSRKARTALRLLAMADGRPLSAERIAEVLWLDKQPRDPAAQFAAIMSRLRRVLGAVRPGLADTNGGVLTTSVSYLTRSSVSGWVRTAGLYACRSRAVDVQMATVHAT